MLCVALVSSFAAPRADARAAAHDFVGAATCKSCHQAEFEVWSKGPHASAFDRLAPDQRKDRRCLSCHSAVASDTSAGLVGVQCESCHGAGRFYAADNVMRDAELRGALGLTKVTKKTCARCHDDQSPSIRPFTYEIKLERIRHWPK